MKNIETTEIKENVKNSEIATVKRDFEVINRNKFFEDRNIQIHTATHYRKTSVDRVDFSLYITGNVNEQRFEIGKNKNIKHEHVADIREALDELGKKFVSMAVEYTSEASFKDIIEEIMKKTGE
jgi:hypothetical protein